MEKDMIVIGGGPGGYVAAIRAAQQGTKVCLIEKDKMGGTCLNRGCIPTKALYRNAEILNTLKNINEFGINIKGYNIDIDVIHERKQKVVEQLVGGIEQLLKANGVEVLRGTAAIKDKNTVTVELSDGTTKEVFAQNIIVATGSKPAYLPISGIDSEGVYTSEEMLNFKSIPERLIVIGGGVVGMEFAGIFNSMGSKVAVVEFLPNIIAQVDTDLTKRLVVSLKKKGIEINTSTKVTSIEKTEAGLIVKAEGKKGELTFEGDAVLLSAGRVPVTEGLGLETLGIEFNRRAVKVDENYETNVKGIYAIGDVNGISMLAHSASHQALYVVDKILGRKVGHSKVTPSCIFIFPEIATAGISEDDAKLQGIKYKTSKFLFGANGKALALGEAEGMVKVIANEEDNTILGVHIMGPHASDLIHEGVLAIEKGMKAEDIANVVHAHPTLSEAFAEATLGILGEAIHMVPSRR